MNRTFFKTMLSIMLAALLVCTAIPVLAKVTAEEAEKLKTELTPMGGERAGNKEGTIPAWTGGIYKVPEGINYKAKSGLPHPDPFAEDKILFTITAQNVDQYKDKLSQGILKLFELYPETWKMHVYPTRRSAAFSKEHYEGMYSNALMTEVADEYGTLKKFGKGYPFPIPKSGAEAILNYIYIPHGEKNFYSTMGGGVVSANGKFTRTYAAASYFYKVESLQKGEFVNPNDYIYGSLIEMQTAGRVGELFLVMEPADYSKNEAVGWSYIPGMRRVRRAPNMFYDGLDSSQGGIGTSDDAYLWQGKIDRFDWALSKEKKEMFVPYNTYKVDLIPDNWDVMMTPHHPNTEYIRWELHRVWENVSTLKEGARHIYGKRVYYQDEDTWMICAKDTYDKRGILWRMQFAFGTQYYDLPVFSRTQWFNFDFQVDFYVAKSYTNGFQIKYDDIPDDFFSIQNLRKMGRR